MFKDLYEATKKWYVIIRNNNKYSAIEMQPNDALVESLLRLNCLTDLTIPLTIINNNNNAGIVFQQRDQQ